jgi:hypothetical protein
MESTSLRGPRWTLIAPRHNAGIKLEKNQMKKTTPMWVSAEDYHMPKYHTLDYNVHSPSLAIELTTFSTVP